MLGTKRLLMEAGKPMALLAALLLLGGWPASAVTLYEQDEFKIKLSGHVQSLSSAYEDPYFALEPMLTPMGPVLVPVQDHVSNNTVRTRATLRMLTGTMLSAEASLDANYVFGSVLDSLLFQMGKESVPPTYFNWEREFVDEDGRWGEFSVYRAMLTWEAESYRVVLGRQRLAYGTGLFWSPIDVWNPVSPLALEPSEKIGVDGASAMWWITDTVTATTLYGIGDDWDETRLAGSVAFQVESYTFDLLVGKLFKDMVYGVDFVGYLGEAGVRGEFTYTVADLDDDFARAVFGVDYAWSNTFYLALEFYHNGGPYEIDPANPFASFTDATGVDTMNASFVGLMASYDFDPVLKGSMAVIVDLDEGSEAFAPSITWSASDNVGLSAGAQLFEGAEGGEYGSYEDLIWARARWDF